MMASQRGTTLQVLLAPWLCMLRPAKAALRLVNAPAGAFRLALAVPALLLAVMVVGLLLWNDTMSARFMWTLPPASAPAATVSPAARSRWVLQTRTLGEVWADWHRQGPIGPAELLIVGIPLLVVACIAFGAWLHLVTIHEGGSVWESYKRAFRAVTGCLGLLCILTPALAGLMIFAEHIAILARANETFTGSDLWAVAIVATPIGVAALLWWVGAAVCAARVPATAGDSAPRCEGCGYDLTHVPRERRCPECGLDVEMSLTPRYSRPGCAWENGRGPITWVLTSLAVLVQPGTFYKRLRLRTEERAARHFAFWHYVALGCSGAAWGFAMSVLTWQGHMREELVVVPIAFFLWTPLCAWAAQHTVAAIGASWALAMGEVSDSRVMRKVRAYECVFLWLPGLFTGAIIASVIQWQLWISEYVFGTRIYFLLGGPVELTVIWLGNLALLLLWMWRYWAAIRAVRWGNF